MLWKTIEYTKGSLNDYSKLRGSYINTIRKQSGKLFFVALC